MKICLIGTGKMATAFKKKYESEVVCNVGYPKNIQENLDYDILVDFSHPDNLKDILSFIKKRKIPAVIGTTNYSIFQLKEIEEAKKQIPICLKNNFSTSIDHIQKILSSETIRFDRADIYDLHHKDKIDSPSGTAKKLIQVLKQSNPKIKITSKSYRVGEAFGTHAIVLKNNQERMVITHQAYSREIFATGAYESCKELLKGEK